jgi:hypothetical protein
LNQRQSWFLSVALVSYLQKSSPPPLSVVAVNMPVVGASFQVVVALFQPAVEASFQAVDAVFQPVEASFQVVVTLFQPAVEASLQAVDALFQPAVEASFQVVVALFQMLEVPSSKADALSKKVDAVLLTVDAISLTVNASSANLDAFHRVEPLTPEIVTTSGLDMVSVAEPTVVLSRPTLSTVLDRPFPIEVKSVLSRELTVLTMRSETELIVPVDCSCAEPTVLESMSQMEQ